MPHGLRRRTYVTESIIEHLDELADEIEQLEFDERYGEGDDAANLKQLIRDTFKTVDQLFRAKTRWLDRFKDNGPIFRTHAPDWYLDFQQDYLTLRVAQHWAQQLDDVLPRLMALPSLALSTRPPTECRVCLEEAARCFLQGLFRAAAVLARTCLETAVRERLRADTRTRTALNRDPLRSLLDVAERLGVLKDEVLASARRAKRIGDEAAHGSQVTQSGASDALQSVRTVLERLYGGEPVPKGYRWSDT